MHVAVLKPGIDTKAESRIQSRIGLEREVDHLVQKGEDIYEYFQKQENKPNAIIVDEAQFLEPKQVDQLMHLVVKDNIPVLCYGLRTDFKTEAFPGSARLLAIAHTLEEMKTICRCGSKGMFNLRMVNGEPVFEGEQIAIDGGDVVTYESVCAKCYYELLEKSKEKPKQYTKK